MINKKVKNNNSKPVQGVKHGRTTRCYVQINNNKFEYNVRTTIPN